MNMQMLFMAE